MYYDANVLNRLEGDNTVTESSIPELEFVLFFKVFVIGANVMGFTNHQLHHIAF